MQNGRYGEVQAAIALVATVVGAGFASGREVLRFFSVFGHWAWVGCIVAAVTLAGLSAWTALLSDRVAAYDLGTLCRRTLGDAGGFAAAWVNGALISVTAGAMLAAMGELAALALPIRHAYAIGVMASLGLAARLAGRDISVMAKVGGWLLPACLLLYMLLFIKREPQQAEFSMATGTWRALPMAFSYASMNTALAGGILCELGQGRGRSAVLRSSVMAGGLFLLLLLGANAVLSQHVDALADAALPVVQLARSYGAAGYWLCILTLSLAVITTLIAVLRTLSRMLESALPSRLAKASLPLALLLSLATGLTGFGTLVGNVYPLLGAASTLLFLAIMAKPLANARITQRH